MTRRDNPRTAAVWAMCRAAPNPRWGGRVVECSGLENRRGLRVTVGSNPTPTALT